MKSGNPHSPTRLIYVDDGLPGITRRRSGKGWRYFDPTGRRIEEAAEIARLGAIALPPAYRDAWFCAAANGHILAIGIDAKGRKQYRYHPAFRIVKEGEKFDGCAQFGRLLPLVRQRVETDMASSTLSLERAVASVVRLLDTGSIRIGNEAYARDNKSFGATTLRMRHARVSRSSLRLRFAAKSGQQRELTLTDRGLARFVRKMQDLPGQHLFQYIDDDGKPCPVSSGEVNHYLRETMGADFTAKHFRTWHASALGFECLAGADRELPLSALLDLVSDRLGNTPKIARQSYIHPAVIDLTGRQEQWRAGLKLPRAMRWLGRYERGLIELLESGPPAVTLLGESATNAPKAR